MSKIFLVDVSNYLFRAYFALPPMTNERGEATHALYGFIRSVQKLMSDFKVEYMAAVFDGPKGAASRKAIYTDYKAHRAAAPEDLPHQIAWAREFCELSGIPVVNVPGVEADDAIGSIAKHWDGEVMICSTDKDLAQMVNGRVHLLNTYKENLVMGPKEVKEKWGVRPDQIVDLLAMMGDASDNIPGLPGFGPKTAAKLLNEFGTLDEILANPEKVPGKKKQETLEKDRELALISRELATINTKVKVPHGKSAYKVKESGDLESFYRDKKFTSLTREEVKAVKPKGREKVSYTIVDSEKELKALVAKLKKCKEICFDTETTGLRPLEAKLVGVGLGVQAKEAWYIPTNGALGHDLVVKLLKPLFEDAKIAFYGHNVKYDLHILENVGIKVKHVGFDTILASYILDTHSRRHGLDHLTLTYFKKVKTTIKSLIGSGKKQKSMMDVPIEKVGAYCCEDVDYTIRLKELFEPELKKRKLDKIFYDIEIPLVPILLEMERNGIYVDAKRLKTMSSSLEKELAKLEGEIFKLAGVEFNLSSPRQLGEVLFKKMKIKPLKKTQTGFSTSADVLEKLAVDHPIAEKVLEWRSLEKLRSTYVDVLPNEVNEETGRIHCTFNQFVAATGRLSCQDPNLQNIPTRSAMGKKIREAFRPEQSSWVYLSADYSQIELRLLAHLSGDPDLIKAFQKGDDIHAYTASKVFDVPLNKVTPAQRYRAKAVNFGILYGQQAFGLSRQLGIDFKDASKFIDAYFEEFPAVREYIDDQIAEAKKTGRTVTMTGRERLIPEIKGRNVIQRQAAERLAVNTPLQGSSADITKLAMIAIAKKLKGLKTKMILQIHDELIFEVPKSELAKLKSLVKKEMEGVFKLKVPLTVDLHVGNNWKEC